MNKNIKQSEILYHSDIYLGQDFSDGIRHWKYIKKVKGSNGKWRYYYKDDKLEDLKNKANQAETKRLAYDLKTSLQDKSYAENAKKNVYYGEKKEGNRLKKEAEKAYNKYKRYSIASIPKKIIGNAISFIANLFNK